MINEEIAYYFIDSKNRLNTNDVINKQKIIPFHATDFFQVTDTKNHTNLNRTINEIQQKDTVKNLESARDVKENFEEKAKFQFPKINQICTSRNLEYNRDQNYISVRKSIEIKENTIQMNRKERNINKDEKIELNKFLNKKNMDDNVKNSNLINEFVPNDKFTLHL